MNEREKEILHKNRKACYYFTPVSLLFLFIFPFQFLRFSLLFVRSFVLISFFILKRPDGENLFIELNE